MSRYQRLASLHGACLVGTMEPLYVLSLWQPWATLCVALDPAFDGLPPKRHETRHWRPRVATPFRLAIHAAKRWDSQNRPAMELEPFRSVLARCGYQSASLPFGAIVGVGIVAAVQPTSACAPATYLDEAFGDWSPDRFAWRLEDVIALQEPIPYRGEQGLAIGNAALKSAIIDQLGRALL